MRCVKVFGEVCACCRWEKFVQHEVSQVRLLISGGAVTCQ